MSQEEHGSSGGRVQAGPDGPTDIYSDLDWRGIPSALRFGRTLRAEDVAHIEPGCLLRLYSPDPWFDPGSRMPGLGDIVRFTGRVNNDFPAVGPHLEVETLGGWIYPGGGWVFDLFQFVAPPQSEPQASTSAPATDEQ
jgi:hypothetical protein